MARRASCPVCGQNVAVTKDGCVMKHGKNRATKGSGRLRGDFCPGSGQKVMAPTEEYDLRLR